MLNSVLNLKEFISLLILSRARLAYKWRSSSGWDDKCHTGRSLTITTAAAAVKLRGHARWSD